MRILIVKLSSLGDVVHTLPVVADLRAAHPGATIDWVVEPSFAPLLERVDGVARVIELPLRRWTRDGFWRPRVWRALGDFARGLRGARYDAVLDLQGLTKSALVAALSRGPGFGLANRTEGSSHEWPARWLVAHPIRVEPRSHALDRGRALVARALGTRDDGAPVYGLRPKVVPADGAGTVVLIHGTSRDDKLWPEAHWIELGRRLAAAGLRIALPRVDAAELARAERLAAAIGEACTVWPSLDLGALVDRMEGAAGAIGVDSGPSHIAVALGLAHVQIYNHPTAWRTGPQARHGQAHQVSVEGGRTPSVDAVWSAWQAVRAAAAAPVGARSEASAGAPAPRHLDVATAPPRR